MRSLFFDANIVLDVLLEREVGLMDALSILDLADRNEVEVFCSPLTLATASYYMEKSKMPHQEIVGKLDAFCKICKLSSIDATIVQRALRSSFADFEDALQYFSAMAVGADIIITRNGSDFAPSILPVMTAKEYIDYLCNIG